MKKILLFSFFIVWVSSLIAQTNVSLEEETSLVNVVKNTIERSPFIQRQLLEISRSKADLQIRQSAFDLHLNSELNYFFNGNHLLGDDPRNAIFDNIKNRDGQLRVGVQKTFRNSLTLQTGLDWTRKENSTPFDEFQQMEESYLSRNTGNLSVNFSQPLLKGKGKEVTTANENAFKKIVNAQEENLIQLSAQELLTSVTTYWQYVSSYQTLQVYKQNEARVRRLLDLTQTLIDADKKPKSEIIQVQADLAEKESQTIQAEQNFFQIQQHLQRVIGFDEKVVLGIPVDDFPSAEVAGFSSIPSNEILHEIALENRMDLKALKLNQAALTDLLLVSNNDLKPQLDLDGIVGYGGFKKGNSVSNLLTLFGEEEGSNWVAGLSLKYLFPLQNNRAEALLSQQNIAIQDQVILLENEKRNIKINVNIAVNNLIQSYAVLQKSRETFNLYLLAYENEQEKFKNGLTTLISVTLFQERLTFAEIQYIQFKQQFAINLANLRYETGALMKKIYFEQKDFAPLDFYKIPKG